MFSVFRNRKGLFTPVQEPQQAMAVAPKIAPDLIYVPPVILKTKKWVVHNNRVGIVADLNEYGFAEIHYTDTKGLTIEVNPKARVGELRLALWEEIPAPRRPKDQTTAFKLGYY